MDRIDIVLDFYLEKNTQFQLDSFGKRIKTFFEDNPVFSDSKLPVIHSVKSRIKDIKRLRDKILSKETETNIVVSESNLFDIITDLVGVRVLHLYFDQFNLIHRAIIKQIDDGEWTLFEQPKAYTWDPEMQEFFEKLNIETHRKDSYTSVHYVVKPNDQPNSVCCEIQVRTLFEEIWGEIDHTINYPHPTDIIACREQLRVLAKLVSTGTRLADSIFRSHHAYTNENR